MKKISLAFSAFLVAAFISACSNNSPKAADSNASNEVNSSSVSASNALDTIKANGVVRIGVFGDKPPFGFIDANGVNQGYDIILAKRIAKELLGDENKVQFVVVEAANRVEFLRSDKVDIILANFTQTPERAEQVDFALPYMKVALGVAVPRAMQISSVEDLKEKTLILNKGTTADAFFTLNHPEIKSVKFDQNTEAFAAFLDGRGDAISHDNTLLFAWVKDKPDYAVVIKELGNKDVIAPAVKKGNAELKKFIDNLIVKLGEEQFFHKAYEASLKDAFTTDINADDVVIEGGKF